MFVTGHYDGHQIQLDEPVKLKPNTKVRIEIPESEEEFRSDWHKISQHSLAKFHKREEAEGGEYEYGLDLVKIPNPLKHT